MILSMTGFGRNFLANDFCYVKTEIKSVNSKYLDLRFRLPKLFNYLEIDLMNIFREKALRGKIDISVDVQFRKPVKIPKINHNMLNLYLDALREIQMESEVLDDIRIDHLIHYDDILEFNEDKETEEKVGAFIKDSVSQALQELNSMRQKEGENLYNDLKERIERLRESAKKIDNLKNSVFDYWFDKFKKRMEKLDIEAQEDRITQEAGFYAEKADITEEVVRVDSHLNQFMSTLEKEDFCGKKLDFISQELHREFNTIGSKSNSADVVNIVVSAKSEIDKIREQVQNIV
ncbi:YicC/YloC family endoribonuclease [Flexistipes sinusarabici]|uniref:YicC/YloC family endoribonuclease n=1 Tax=Flexistipes sinusarabici TaxID=2352 RepID=UPI002357AE5B|nr:YicC/YloC family endoribonuclease [Flexistipes sinusarabici]